MPFTGPAQKKAVTQMLSGDGAPQGKGGKSPKKREEPAIDPALIDEIVTYMGDFDAEAMMRLVASLERLNPDAVSALADAVAATFGDSEDASDESDSGDEEE